MGFCVSVLLFPVLTLGICNHFTFLFVLEALKAKIMNPLRGKRLNILASIFVNSVFAIV